MTGLTRKTFMSVGLTAGILAAITIALPESASAVVLYPSCGGGATKTSTSTSSYMGGCFSTQARIDRYYAGVPRSYYGPQGKDSNVTASDGTLIGNYARYYVANSGDPGKHWTSWIKF
ncbi:hypothetical protein ACQP1V_31175 [Microtetraspora malaysiensis]|uniref:hypothetical protein n=1 Tax=Microtetraspora malaysiensis TaxID=161358 RepID=UPI003D90233E